MAAFWRLFSAMKRLLPLLPLLLIFACNSEENTEKPPYQDELIGLAKPLRLAPDTTIIHLQDFFLNPEDITGVSIDGTSAQVDSVNHTIEWTTPLSESLGLMSVNYGGRNYDIPLIRSEKVQYAYVYNGSPDAESVQVKGSMNGWNPSASPLEKTEGGWTTTFTLAPGVHSYRLVIDGEEMVDPNNPNRMDNGFGGENSYFTIGDPDAKRPRLDASVSNDSLKMKSYDGGKLLLLWEDQQIMKTELEEDKYVHITIPAEAADLERSHIRAWVYNDQMVGEDYLIPLENGQIVRDPSKLNRSDLHTWSMYFLLVDRFADGDADNNDPVDDPEILPIANHFGGDMAGIKQKVNDGYFADLGFNTIWVSPITTNAEGAWGLWDKGIRSKFSGYHGYWPVRSKEIDPHFGDDSTFRALIDDAHGREMNLIVDYVANHVHQEHPVYVENPDWATELYLPNGSLNTERWDEYRLTTWFDTFLPTLDLERAEVYEPMTDSAMFWLENYDIDGFRHDATKHIPEVFWRTLTKKAKERVLAKSDRHIYQVGETYGNPELISSYVSSGQLDAQFDFNYYDAMVDALAKDHTDFSNLQRVLEESLKYYGDHHLMGNITGNQDRARFISYADGALDFAEDAKLAGWTREITNQGPEGYEKLTMLHALLMTSPGVPCLYYGDEIGLPGGNDPDNRRMMQFDGLNEDQLEVRNTVSELANLRQDRMSLQYGSTRVMMATEDFLVLRRNYLGELTTLVICKNPKGASVALYEAYETTDSEMLSTMNAKKEDGELVFSGRGYAMIGMNNGMQE